MKQWKELIAAAALVWAVPAFAQQPAPAAAPAAPSAAPQQPQFPDATFFVTSKAGPDGANLGGLEGADRHCQTLATAAGAGGKTWHAYLSTQATGGATAVNARDRIGKGPWKNVRGVEIAASVDDLHKENKINLDNGLTERGQKIPGSGYLVVQHDILTGSTKEGMAFPADKDMTCRNWTSGKDGTAMVGHVDRNGTAGDRTSWNAAHPSRGCDMPALISTGGAGLLYCFAAN